MERVWEGEREGGVWGEREREGVWEGGDRENWGKYW